MASHPCVIDKGAEELLTKVLDDFLCFTVEQRKEQADAGLSNFYMQQKKMYSNLKIFQKLSKVLKKF